LTDVKINDIILYMDRGAVMMSISC